MAVKRELQPTQIHQSRVRLNTAPQSANATAESENIVERLGRRLAEAQSLGNVVRREWLDGQQASWCELRGVRTIFLDASQTASDQLAQLEEILVEMHQTSSPKVAAMANQLVPPRAA